jgi:hypothetical protein
MDDDAEGSLNEAAPKESGQPGQGGGPQGPTDDVTGESRPARHRTLIGTQGALQVVLGIFWIADAALQYQPFMFGHQFVTTYVLGNASGQPAPISWLITSAGNFISPDIAVWNALFATLQVLIGVGLFFPRTVRSALATSFVWAFCVWFFGEGLGMILTGSASALTGAPGSVFLYAMLGLMAWPRRATTDTAPAGGTRKTGIASSAAAQGIGGGITPLAVWSGYWLLSAVLFLLPAHRSSTSVSSAVTGMTTDQPGWYAHFLTHFGNDFSSIGTQTTLLLAIASVVIGLGPLLFRHVEVFLALGGLLAAAFWVSGQGLGGVLTGTGTDPNSGPLVVVLALAMVPVVVPDASSWTPPLLRLYRTHPALELGGAVAALCALLLAATYPAAAQQPSGSMSGITGMSGTRSMESGTVTASTAHCSADNNGAGRNGLDVTNSPNMRMAGPGTTMNMNGADASAAAGLNSVKENWSYAGPALPTAEANRLLTDGVNGPTDVHMAETGCASQPTFSEEINAVQYVQATSHAVARFSTVAAAVAAGYEPVSPLDYPVTYLVNPQIVSANDAASRTFDPGAIDGLVFAQIPSGQQVLAAAMYLLPTSLNGHPPMPFGALVQWHQRVDVCAPLTNTTSSPLEISGVTPCAAGTTQQATPYMTMVWQVPVAGGPLAIQPPDIQIVEAAVTASTP